MRMRKSEERGYFKNYWLEARHSFSFSSYYDEKWLHFGRMRVLNHDRVAPETGFGSHPHDNMEIVTYIIRGLIEHEDSMGNKKQIKAGEVQRMSAGTGVTHSEMNPSASEELELFQLWFFPERKGDKPSYEQKGYSREEKLNQLRLVVSPEGKDGSVQIHTPVHMFASVLEPKKKVSLEKGFEKAWIQVATGKIRVAGIELAAGDGVGLDPEDLKKEIEIEGLEESEFIIICP